MVCVVCDSSNNQKVFEEFGFNVFRCECSHLFSDSSSRDNYDGYFGTEELSIEGTNWWNEAHELLYADFIKKVLCKKKVGNLLDVGCGLGYFVKTINEKTNWKADGVETSSVAVKFAKEKLGQENIFLGSVDLLLESKFYDIVAMIDVLEHIPEPNSLLQSIGKKLAPAGLLFIHTPNAKIQLFKARIKRWLSGGIKGDGHYLEAADHVNVYTAASLRAVLKNNGYNNIKFIHLRPIQNVSGFGRGALLLKNVWFYTAVILFKITFGIINVNNLFVIARK